MAQRPSAQNPMTEEEFRAKLPDLVHSGGHPWLSYQPFQMIFKILYGVTVVVRLPYWLIISLVAWLRPHPAWTFKQTLMSRLVYVVFDIRSRLGFTNPIALDPGTEGDRFQVIEPADSNIYRGPLTFRSKPEAVGGTWSPQPPGKDITSKTVLLYLHGGAFVDGDGRDDLCGFAAETLLERGGVDAMFSLQYRLSGWSRLSPFPAALQDALTAYVFLVRKLKIQPRHIVLGGDSAGANLAIGLLRYIKEFGPDLKISPPKYAALMSPWVAPLDLEVDSSPQRSTDYLPRSYLYWGSHVYAGGLKMAAKEPYITPLGNPFATPTTIFVNAGTAEVLLDSTKNWVEEMRRVGDNQIELHLEEGAPHDTMLFGNVLGFEESAQKVASALGAFLRKN
ncbi:hypothetical protein S40285_08427 [Stachybotrys chlorohalonatus IBT 40285]|uniref:Alpha/beta hydrolase fold-3 domain-containing protein n=1 Tax=Stachybotrys chlorohalonatus (strain IBT 40285) TaxID=1283841 RepID=A0A084R0W8_STAC4|nr:hypothetical protein S40285_08427 [Stachybotrys chlorohalonata IBT 40285]